MRIRFCRSPLIVFVGRLGRFIVLAVIPAVSVGFMWCGAIAGSSKKNREPRAGWLAMPMRPLMRFDDAPARVEGPGRSPWCAVAARR